MYANNGKVKTVWKVILWMLKSSVIWCWLALGDFLKLNCLLASLDNFLQKSKPLLVWIANTKWQNMDKRFCWQFDHFSSKLLQVGSIVIVWTSNEENGSFHHILILQIQKWMWIDAKAFDFEFCLYHLSLVWIKYYIYIKSYLLMD